MATITSSSSSSSTLITNRQTQPVYYALKFLDSPETQRQYRKRLETFFNDIGMEGQALEEKGQAFLAQAANNKRWVEDTIVAFIDHHKQRVSNSNKNSNSGSNKIRPGTLRNYLYPIQQFYDVHSDDLPALNWKRIRKLLPPAKSASNDRTPTIEEIKKIVEFTDRRIKPLIYTMISSGIRVDAWTYLNWKHVKPIYNSEYLRWKKEQLRVQKKDDEYKKLTITDEDEKKIIAAKLIVYNKEYEEYFSFITPEAYQAL